MMEYRNFQAGGANTAQLAIRGDSNRGLLLGACMVQRPELFGAVLSEQPLLDMAYFHMQQQGGSWIDEYGDPEDAEDLSLLMAYSPYHNVQADVAYPPVLFMSAAEDRLHPGHARKMAAKMQSQGHGQVWYLEHREGGQGMFEPEAIARIEATAFTFLKSTVGLNLIC